MYPERSGNSQKDSRNHPERPDHANDQIENRKDMKNEVIQTKCNRIGYIC